MKSCGHHHNATLTENPRYPKYEDFILVFFVGGLSPYIGTWVSSMEFPRCSFENFAFNGNSILYIHIFFSLMAPSKLTQTVTLQTCVREAFYSVLGQVTDDSEVYCCFAQSLGKEGRQESIFYVNDYQFNWSKSSRDSLRKGNFRLSQKCRSGGW